MKTLHDIPMLRAALADARAGGRSIGLVPTMGYLHEGHASLIRRARERCDVIVVSLFVNPAQFDDPADLAAYPRDAAGDEVTASAAGADILFAPSVDALYPPGFATSVSVTGVSEPLEGAHRGRRHFDGVATIVTKLLNIVGPDIVFFGQKDAQQVLVIRRLVLDLDMPVEVEVCPTVREPDGLALSSRNARLSGDQRERALALSRALRGAEATVAAGERDIARIRAAALAVLHEAELEPEYLELVATDDLEPVVRLDRSVLLAVAARIGDVRLIDNVILSRARSSADPLPPAHVRSPT
jgi:pantoate--beta-alanine ligase